MTTPRPIRRVCQFLRLQDIPAFRLRIVPGLSDEGVWADVGKGARIFTIRLDAALAQDYPEVAALLVLHEAAHIVSWDTLETDHGPMFALSYSMLYRLWQAELS